MGALRVVASAVAKSSHQRPLNGALRVVASAVAACLAAIGAVAA